MYIKGTLSAQSLAIIATSEMLKHCGASVSETCRTLTS